MYSHEMTSIWTMVFGVLAISGLEIFLSLDNAIVLAMIARKLPEAEQKRALRYGLIGAMMLRLVAVGIAAKLIHYPWIKILGGLYLAYLALKYFFGKKSHKHAEAITSSFWKTVFVIEFTDLVFAIDSILAAVAITQNYWVVVIGGLIGVVAIRFTAQWMIHLLARFPKLESIAYAFIAIVAVKTLYEGAHSFW